jgi:cytoskeletal protein RodZ
MRVYSACVLNAESTVGSDLRRSRELAGLSLADISEYTRIRVRIIEAIEADNYSLCGGVTYARGHIRQIAKAVGLDPEILLIRVNWDDLDG